jgi:predicted RNA-binding protein YlxR (DUF448 family)
MTGPNNRVKHVPERTCIACRQRRAKWELVRIVRSTKGELEIDLRGKKAGRGAYICKAKDCWETALTKKRIEYALKYKVTAEQSAAFRQYLENLCTNAEEQEISV